MKPPSKKILSILKNKLHRYGDPGEHYYGGTLTYYEVKILAQYFKLKLDKNEYNWVKYCSNLLEKGKNGSVSFYFHREGNKKIFKELELEL